MEGCCNFAVYAEYVVREALDLRRYRRNQRILLESPFSLDMQYEDSNESVGAADSEGRRLRQLCRAVGLRAATGRDKIPHTQATVLPAGGLGDY